VVVVLAADLSKLKRRLDHAPAEQQTAEVSQKIGYYMK
jgi:tetrahydromethanopterin S-methyltransferase subunit G